MDAGVHAGLTELQAGAKPAVRKTITRLMAIVPKPAFVPLRAFFFERFRLFAGDREILPDQWKSRKAMTLFKYLLAMQARGYVEKEVLMELLWQEEDPRKSSQRFHVALAAIRKTLEPEILKGIRSAYIKRSGQAYRIELMEKGQVDADRFSRAVQAGNAAEDTETAMRRYSQAQALYKGDFLEEDVYEQWCSRERTAYKTAFLSVLKKMMEFHVSKKDYSRAITAANTYLEMDPYAEEMIRRLMRYYSASGNSAMVSRVYQKFTRTIQAEFNCRLSPKTRELFHKLSRPQPEVWDTQMLESFKISGSL
jgi:DNA-binding SARP family transcriptional activator